MIFTPLDVNEETLTINGVQFPEKEFMLEISTVISANMYEGFAPTQRTISMAIDFCLDKITSKDVTKMIMEFYEPTSRIQQQAI
jgi:hypothetical protein